MAEYCLDMAALAKDSEVELVAGVELGGTKCVCILAGSPSHIVAQKSFPTTTPAETLGAIRRTLAEWQEATRFRALGIASFGPVDLDPSSDFFGSITSTTKPGWSDTDVLGALTENFPGMAAFDTDVNGAALAEMRWGAGQGLSDFAYITVGTGVGVGLIVNGEATRGFAHCELGHIRIPRLPGDDWPGSCPYHGDCVEGLASGTAITARLSGRRVSDVAPTDPIWEGVAHAIAQLCHVIVCTAAPKRIVVGGGVTAKQPQLIPRIEALLRQSLAGYLELPLADAYVAAPELGPQAGPLGPIALAKDLLTA